MSRILVYRIGSIGDTLVAVPAIRLIRRHFAQSHVALLADRWTDLVGPEQALSGTGLIEVGLGLDAADRSRLDGWLAGRRPDGGRPWVAVCAASKMPAKVWPEERYREVVVRLIGELDVWPVVFGGAGDRPLGDRLVEAWHRGYNLCGAVGVRSDAVALSRCKLYLGNDTGTMHLAASVGLPCVAIFSARCHPGLWDPFGEGHVVLRHRVPCEGCQLTECVDEAMRCVLATGVDEVHAACRRILTPA